MKERIRQIYKDKAEAYLEVLEGFDNYGIPYILLNTLVSDDNPGDLDVLLCDGMLNDVQSILINHGFEYYTEYEKGQTLWNKYLDGIGFVQFHIYDSLYVCNKEYFPSHQINRNLKDSCLFHFYVFLIESLYKMKLRRSQYREYRRTCSIDSVINYVAGVYPDFMSAVNYIIHCYENNRNISPTARDQYLWAGRKLAKWSSIIKRLLRRLNRLFHRNDIFVLFLGVDGSGKSTQIDMVYNVLSKGGLYPQKLYMGLRESRFVKKKDTYVHKSLSSSQMDSSPILPLTLFRLLKLFLFWLEYNSKYLLKIVFCPFGVKTVYLIDRCYVDLLFFYPYLIVENLFLKWSFVPNKIVFFTGNENVLYDRKQEMSQERFHLLYMFYSNLSPKISSLGGKVTKICDTTRAKPLQIRNEILNFIVDL